MKRSSRLTTSFTALLVVVALLACKKSKSEEGSTASAASGESTGVPECDEYLAKYEKCVDEKVPAVAKPGIKEAIGKMRTTYKTSASNPVAKAGLGQGCKQALETTKQAMAQYNCTW